MKTNRNKHKGDCTPKAKPATSHPWRKYWRLSPERVNEETFISAITKPRARA